MSLNATWITLLFACCATAIAPIIARGDSKDGGFGPFEAAEVQCMKEAEAAYVFSVHVGSSETPDQRHLRWLEPEAREALVATLCNPDNWNFVTSGYPCEDRDIGVLFQKPADYTGFDADGTFNQKPAGGWIKQQPWESWKQRFAHAEMR
jgi:hypothetical protein